MTLNCSFSITSVLRRHDHVLRLSCLVLSILAIVLAVRPLAAAQDHGQPQDQPAAQPHGVPFDWSHHHVIFSNPGTAEDAMRKGAYDHWFHTVNDPRYQQDQVRRHRHQEPNEGQREWGKRHEAESGGLWGQSLGSVNAAVGAGMYPAKYSFDSNTLNCASATEPDYVVYNTSVAGATGGQASVIAFDNIYTTTCTPSTAVPTVYWSYNTGGTVSTSVTLSEDGYQAAFVQSVGTKATLVILKYKGGQGASATSAVLPDSVTAAGATYATCRTGTTSCELELQFANVGTPTPATPNDTNSPPFYDYNADTLWVGDNSGYLHKFTGVFKGTPGEITTGGWPIHVTTETGLTSSILTGPVYDSTSGLIFVNDATGYLHSVNAANPTGTGNIQISTQMECGVGFKDPPIVDSTTEYVYDFIAYGCDPQNNPARNSYINRFPAGTALNGGYGTALNFANGGANNPNTGVARTGTFDNTYYSGTGSTGNIYYCVDGRVYKIPIALTAAAQFSTPVGAVGSAANCSGITEFYGTSATTTLSGILNAGATNTTVHVNSTSGFTVGSTTSFYIQVDSEIMLLSAVNTGPSTFTVTRGRLGTSANQTHNPNAPVNEIHDWLFLSVLAGGNSTGCNGSCLYNYDVLSGGGTGNPVAGLPVVGGTSGISIDNTALNGGSQIYFTYQGSATTTVKCPSPSGGTGIAATTGGCAVQATQLGLN